MQTLEKVPHIDHYRDMHEMAKAMSCRPTLHELLEPEEMVCYSRTASTQLDEEEKLQSFIPPEVTPIIGKLGWIKGVLVNFVSSSSEICLIFSLSQIRCILCILGVMLYLRLSWVSAQAGIGLGCVIVLLGSTVTTLTALSLCAISTNGEVKGGGAYFLISRSLGPEFGGSIGLIFSFANAVAAAMYIVGFAESVRDLLKEYKTHIFENSTNDVRVIALAAAVVLLGVVMVGVQFETKAQMILLVVLAISLVSFILGTFFSPDEEKLSRGITGYKWSTFHQNLGPDWRKETFFSVFAIYFPAATGIMAGANISGDLADPQKSIPKGTLLAIAITTVIYLSGVVLTGSTCVRDAPGAENFTLPINETIASFISRPLAACISQGNCPFGLHNYFRVGQLDKIGIMELESIFSPLVTGGVFAATLSSALASLVSAPKIFQALCKDKLFPYITYFATGFGKSDEPRPGYFLSFFIACSLICIGDLNAIAPIISNFFLASYALINYACFDASFANSPGWRPAFKYYNMWLSLFGAVVCMSVMFLISWQTALLTYAIIFTLYIYLLRRKPDVNWGSSSQAHAYRNALNSIIRLNNIEEHVRIRVNDHCNCMLIPTPKILRPQILALTGFPANRSILVDFATNITKDNSMLICGHVITSTEVEKRYQTIQKFMNQATIWLRCRKTKAFYVPVAADTVEQGVMSLLQLSGLAKLKPNIMLMGFKHDWRSCPGSEINSYVNMIHHAFDHMLAVGILRLSDGAEFNRQVSVVDSKSQICLTTNDSEPHMPL
uniref:Solute carrier family 12 member 1 n=1 Tax=Romanomermis culicivorax TaxID=13658 RepID=A0A915JBP4_ROMCU